MGQKKNDNIAIFVLFILMVLIIITQLFRGKDIVKVERDVADLEHWVSRREGNRANRRRRNAFPVI